MVYDNWAGDELNDFRKEPVRYVMEIMNPYLRKTGRPILQISGTPDHPTFKMSGETT